MQKRKKIALLCLLAALCLGLGLGLGVILPGKWSSAKADTGCVHSYRLTGSVEATCMVDAYDVYECSLCGDAFYDYSFGTALGHNWDEEQNIIRIEPTCTTMGMDYHVCTRCWNTYQDSPVSPLGHEWSNADGIVHTATCTEKGFTEFVCVREGCGYSYRTDETALLEHSYSLDGERCTERTCTENGVAVYVCTMCGRERTEYDYATGHRYSDETTSPGCISYGYTTHTCAECGDRYVTDYVSPVGHTYELTEVAASETSYGYVQLTCTACGYIYITNIVTSGDAGYTHDYVLHIHEPTCFSEGYWEYVCEDCGETIICNPTAQLIHGWSYEYHAPTCTEGGGWVYVCALCGSYYFDEYEEALGHDYLESVTEPTCTADGYSAFVCRNCGDKYFGAYTAATGHKFEVRNAVVSTSQKTLTLSYVCTGCLSSAVSRLEVVFTDNAGASYTYYFSSSGVADFSSLPEGNYTASVVDTYLGTTVSMFTVSASSGLEDSDGAGEEEASSGDTEHVHVFAASVSVSPSAKTLVVSYNCPCGEDLTDEVYVSFRGGSGAWTFSPVSGKVDYSAVPAGDYTVCLFFGDEELSSFALTVPDDLVEDLPDTDSGEEDHDDDFEDEEYDSDGGAGDPAAGEESETDGQEDTPSGDTEGAENAEGETFVPDTATQTTAEDDDGGNATLVIILIIVFVVFVGAIVAVWIVFRRRSKKQKTAEDEVADAEDEDDE